MVAKPCLVRARKFFEFQLAHPAELAVPEHFWGILRGRVGLYLSRKAGCIMLRHAKTPDFLRGNYWSSISFGMVVCEIAISSRRRAVAVWRQCQCLDRWPKG